jgi:hypothetical protein
MAGWSTPARARPIRMRAVARASIPPIRSHMSASPRSMATAGHRLLPATRRASPNGARPPHPAGQRRPAPGTAAIYLDSERRVGRPSSRRFSSSLSGRRCSSASTVRRCSTHDGG